MFVSHFQRSMETAAIQGLRARFAHTAPGYLIPRRWRSNLFRAGGAPTYSAPVALQLIPRRWRSNLFRAGGAPTYSAPVALQLIPRRWRSKPEFFVQSRSPMHVEVL